MSRLTLLALWFLLATTTLLAGIAVKVTAVDYRNGQVTLLLPIHHARFEATLLPEEPEIRLRLNEFYDAEIEQGHIGTLKRNVLAVKIPDQKPVRLRLRKITFLSQ